VKWSLSYVNLHNYDENAHMCPHMEEHLSLGVKTQDDKN
jgi:hypothetical protein